MSPDLQASRGERPYQLGRCGCTHLEALHAINTAGARSGCSASSCPCRRYEPEEKS